MQDSLEAEAEVLLDPNALSEDGTVSLNTLSVSKNAEFLAYGLSSSGSDWVTIKLMRIQDKSVLADTLSWVSFRTRFTETMLNLLNENSSNQNHAND